MQKLSLFSFLSSSHEKIGHPLPIGGGAHWVEVGQYDQGEPETEIAALLPSPGDRDRHVGERGVIYTGCSITAI